MRFDPYLLAAPLLRRLDAESAHRMAVRLLRTGLAARIYRPESNPPSLVTQLWGREFANPIGLAPGFDKNAEVPAALLGLGFGFVEVGGVTPRAQAGNPRPRVFRLNEDRAVINRMGFNNDGAAAIAARLAGVGKRDGLIGVNLGKNKDSTDPTADYAAGAGIFAQLADFLVVNVSSPNTPGLRTLQNIGPLTEILTAVRDAAVAATHGHPPPILVKIAPDLALDDVGMVVGLASEQNLCGVVVGNTTLSRPSGLTSANRDQVGGLSGRPLFELSTTVLRHAFKVSAGRLPLIGVGGVSSGADAYAKIRAGASAIQLYTAMVFEGPRLVDRIKSELAALLARDGFKHVAEAVGADH